MSSENCSLLLKFNLLAEENSAILGRFALLHTTSLDVMKKLEKCRTKFNSLSRDGIWATNAQPTLLIRLLFFPS